MSAKFPRGGGGAGPLFSSKSKTNFFIDMGLLSNFPAYCGQLVKLLITLEPNGIFGSKFCFLHTYLF